MRINDNDSAAEWLQNEADDTPCWVCQSYQMFKPDHYYLFDEMTQLLQSYVTKYPKLATLESLGKTPEQREVWLLTLTNSATGIHSSKPAVWIDANTHAGEVTGCQAALYFANNLLTQYGKNLELTTLLDQLTFYFVPRISVDGAELYLSTAHTLRSSTMRWPHADMIEAHYQKDINNDGRILMMRKADPAGAFKISKKNPQLMISRGHEDFDFNKETFYHLYTEGEFNQYDGFTKNFSREHGFDLNRQFASGFRPEGQQVGAGPYPHYLPEAQFLVKAVTERPNISVAHTYHTYGGMILRLPGQYDEDKMDPQDLFLFKTFCDSSAEKMGYKVYTLFKDFRYDAHDLTTGTFDEWLYSHRGIFASTVEIWDVASAAGLPFTGALDCYFSPSEDHLLAIYNWCEIHLPKESFHVAWQPYLHPQLGEIEIGGWDWKFVFQNPPKKFLENELKKVFQGSLSLAKCCPLVKISSVQKTKLSESHWKLEIIIKNEGYLPTHGSAQAIKSAAARKPRVYLTLDPNLKLITGKTEFEIEHLEGRSARGRRNTPVWYSEIANQHEARLEWVLQGSGQVQVKINLERGGLLNQTIDLT